MLVLTAHHIATDAWSQDLIMDELAAGYAAARGQGAPRLRCGCSTPT
ncbi:hypothetical protein ACFQY4_20325 [Catellatospora bangladeshensis]